LAIPLGEIPKCTNFEGKGPPNVAFEKVKNGEENMHVLELV
jgi:hypothetical protein